MYEFFQPNKERKFATISPVDLLKFGAALRFKPVRFKEEEKTTPYLMRDAYLALRYYRSIFLLNSIRHRHVLKVTATIRDLPAESTINRLLAVSCELEKRKLQLNSWKRDQIEAAFIPTFPLFVFFFYLSAIFSVASSGFV